MICAVSINVITSEVYRIFLWNKKQWKADEIVFLMTDIFIYLAKKVFPKYFDIPNISGIW